MQFSNPNSQPKTALAAAVVGGVSLVPFVLATPHHATAELVAQLDRSALTISESETVAEETVEPPFLVCLDKSPQVA